MDSGGSSSKVESINGGRMNKLFKICLVVSAIWILLISPAASQRKNPDISGIWNSSIDLVYRIEVTGNRFTWRVESTGQVASGTINGRQLRAIWKTPGGNQSATGRIAEVSDDGRALRIQWSNLVVFTRPSLGREKRIREEPHDFVQPEVRGGDNLSGEWGTNIGLIIHIDQKNGDLKINIEGDDNVYSGKWEGDKLRIDWPIERGKETLRSRMIEREPTGRVVFIEWSNGLTFQRMGGHEESPVPMEPAEDLRIRIPDISGEWFSNKGPQYKLHQTGEEFRLVNVQTKAERTGRLMSGDPHWHLRTESGGEPWEGFVIEVDPNGMAHLMEWTHGLLMAREPFPESGVPMERDEARDERVFNIAGTWTSSIRRTYEIKQQGPEFTWTVKGTQEKASGVIEGEILRAEWSGGSGAGHAEGRIIEADESGLPIRIEWSNGVVFNRTSQVAPDQAAGRPERKVEMAEPPKGIIKAEISPEALNQLIPHLMLKSVFNQWVKVGGPIGGLGYDVRYSSNDRRGVNIIYVTDNYSGVNKSIDGGQNWYASNSGINARTGTSGDAIPVFSLTVDPNNPNIVWAGLKDMKGAYKSTDGGTTWSDVTPNIPESQFVFRGFTIMPGDSNTVFAQGEIPTEVQGLAFNKVKGRIYLTRNGGRTWSNVWEGNDLVRYVIINPQDHNTIYASCGIFDREAFNSNCKSPSLKGPDLENSWKDRGGVGILRSRNGGQTWEILNRKNGLKDLYVGSLVMHPKNPNILLAGCGNNAASPYRVDGKPHYTGGVFRTEDGGQTWIQTLKDDVITSVEFSPSNPNIAYAGGRPKFYVSEDAGKTWTLVSGGKYPWGPPGVIAGFPIDVLVSPFNPSILFANNYGGGNVKSTDGGRTWSLASQGYTGALMFDIDIHPNNSDIVYAAARSGLFRTMNAGAKWEGLSFPPAMFPECYSVAIHPKIPQIIIASQELLGTVYQSKDGGKNWQSALKLPAIPGNPIETYGFKRIVFAPSAPNVVYAATCRGSNKLDDHPSALGVYKSTQNGVPQSWSEANNPLMKKQAVNDLAVHPKNHNIVYAGTANGGLFKTTNGGNIWSVIPALANKDIRSVAIDPKKPRTVFAGLQKGGIFRSSDDGNTWHQMAAGMNQNQPVWAIVVDPVDNTVWAGTRRSGVFRWDSIEQQWVATNKGLSTKAIVDLEISADGRVLYASTTGEGVFRYAKK